MCNSIAANSLHTKFHIAVFTNMRCIMQVHSKIRRYQLTPTHPSPLTTPLKPLHNRRHTPLKTCFGCRIRALRFSSRSCSRSRGLPLRGSSKRFLFGIDPGIADQKCGSPHQNIEHFDIQFLSVWIFRNILTPRSGFLNRIYSYCHSGRY